VFLSVIPVHSAVSYLVHKTSALRDLLSDILQILAHMNFIQIFLLMHFWITFIFVLLLLPFPTNLILVSVLYVPISNLDLLYMIICNFI
jgi:hypothetical protein